MAFSLLQQIRLTQIIALLFGITLGAMLLSGRARRSAVALAAALLVAALAISAIRLSIYWQIAPLWAAALVGIFAVAKTGGRLAERWLGAVVLCGAVLSAASVLAVPLFRLPSPKGPFPVGTRIVHLIDWTRTDDSFPSHHRELMVQVWYPAAPDGQLRAPYRRKVETTWLSSYDAVLKTPAYENAPVAARGSPFPIVVFNPGWEGQRTQNTYQTINLASYGFVVIAIDHTHNSTPVAFPDGQVLSSTEPRNVDDFAGESLSRAMSFADSELNREVRDDEFVLNSFSSWNGIRQAGADAKNDSWRGKLDFSQIGAMGHSFGGAVSIALCERDPRVLSAMNMDGWIFGALHPANTHKPLMVMYSTGWPFVAADVARERASKDDLGYYLDTLDLDELLRLLPESGGYILAFPGTLHMNFTDRVLYSPFRSLTGAGRESPIAVQRVINAYTVAFFKQTLLRQRQTLLHEPSPFSETKVEGWSVAGDTSKVPH